MGTKSRNFFNKIKTSKNFYRFFILFFLLLIFILLIITSFNIYYNKYSFQNSMISFLEMNSKNIFSIDNIHIFSSATAQNTSTNSSWNLNIHQYSDIAIYINNHANDYFTPENTIKSLTINNIKFNHDVNGTPNIFYKDVYNFGKYVKDDNNIIYNDLEYSIIPTTDTISYDKPQLYSTCSNPITLSYINSDIKQNYNILDNTISLDGSILKKCNIPLSAIENSISFTINLTNNLDKLFKANVYIDIPLSTATDSIYEGKIIQNNNRENLFKFYTFDT